MAEYSRKGRRNVSCVSDTISSTWRTCLRAIFPASARSPDAVLRFVVIASRGGSRRALSAMRPSTFTARFRDIRNIASSTTVCVTTARAITTIATMRSTSIFLHISQMNPRGPERAMQRTWVCLKHIRERLPGSRGSDMLQTVYRAFGESGPAGHSDISGRTAARSRTHALWPGSARSRFRRRGTTSGFARSTKVISRPSGAMRVAGNSIDIIPDGATCAMTPSFTAWSISQRLFPEFARA
jgi:hypothetical protein